MTQDRQLALGLGTIVTGGVTMDQFVLSLSRLAGGLVSNGTGLEGWYAISLQFAPPGLATDPSAGDDAPGFLTAVQEQLGLKLLPKQIKVPVFVVDHIERPTAN